MGDATSVGIAIVEHGGRYLVGSRGPEGPLAGLAEFPGGKCLPDEPADRCACRECLEETGLEVAAVRLLERTAFDYPHGRVDLSFWLCHPVHAADVADQQGEFRWVPAAELESLTFPEANASVVQRLSRLRTT